MTDITGGLEGGGGGWGWKEGVEGGGVRAFFLII